MIYQHLRTAVRPYHDSKMLLAVGIPGVHLIDTVLMGCGKAKRDKTLSFFPG